MAAKVAVESLGHTGRRVDRMPSDIKENRVVGIRLERTSVLADDMEMWRLSDVYPPGRTDADKLHCIS